MCYKTVRGDPLCVSEMLPQRERDSTIVRVTYKSNYRWLHIYYPVLKNIPCLPTESLFLFHLVGFLRKASKIIILCTVDYKEMSAISM